LLTIILTGIKQGVRRLYNIDFMKSLNNGTFSEKHITDIKYLPQHYNNKNYLAFKPYNRTSYHYKYQLISINLISE